MTSGNATEAGSSALAVAVLPSWHFAGPGAIAVASASGLSPAGWTIAVLAAAAAMAVYLVSAAIWPYGPCLGCIGHPGKKRGSNARRWGRCKRCKGTGQRTRWGYRLIQHFKAGA